MDSLENPIAKGKIRSLPLDLWPEADRAAWISACRPAARLTRGGAASHLKPITRDDLARRYGYFLDFLGRHGLLQINTLAATFVTPENVEHRRTQAARRFGDLIWLNPQAPACCRDHCLSRSRLIQGDLC